MTGIQWTDEVWNPIVGCSRVSEGCRNCYAEIMARRIACAADARDIAENGPITTETQKAYQSVVKRAGGYIGGTPLPQWNGKVVLIEEKLTDPLRWKKPRRVFVNSMSDLFHEALTFEQIDRVFAVMALCPQHTFQVLTKRPERMAEYLNRREQSKAFMGAVRGGGGGDPESMRWKTPCDRVYTIAREMRGYGAAPMLTWPLPNVWLGASAEDRPRADERIPHLLKCPAAVRFLSVEPLLGEVDLLRVKSGVLGGDDAHHVDVLRGGTWRFRTPSREQLPHFVQHSDMRTISWVIVGGESGPHARPCNIGWIRSIVEQCKAAGVPVFVKQMGANVEQMDRRGWPEGTRFDVAESEEWWRVALRDSHGGDMDEWPEDLRVREFPPADRGAGHSSEKCPHAVGATQDAESGHRAEECPHAVGATGEGSGA